MQREVAFSQENDGGIVKKLNFMQKTIPQSLRDSSLYTREPSCLCKSPIVIFHIRFVSGLRNCSSSSFFSILRLKVLVQITRYHTVIELADLVGTATVASLKSRMRGDDVDLPRQKSVSSSKKK